MSISALNAKMRGKRLVAKQRIKVSTQPGKTPTGGIYDPIETHPMWHNLAGLEDSVFWLAGGVIHVEETPLAPDQSIAYSNLNLTDFEIGAIFLHEGGGIETEIYQLAGRMSSPNFRDFIGVSAYKGFLAVWQRKGGTWMEVLQNPPPSSIAVGKRVTLRVVGSVVELEVEGEGTWSGTATLMAPGRIGMGSRKWDRPGAPIIRNFSTIFWERLYDSNGDQLFDSGGAALYAPLIHGKLRTDKMRSF